MAGGRGGRDEEDLGPQNDFGGHSARSWAFESSWFQQATCQARSQQATRWGAIVPTTTRGGWRHFPAPHGFLVSREIDVALKRTHCEIDLNSN